jgi:hypothetical protein
VTDSTAGEPDTPEAAAAVVPAPRDVPPSATQLFDDSLTERFDKATIRALNKWCQADLVAGLRLFFAGPKGRDSLTGFDGESDEPGLWSVTILGEPSRDEPGASAVDAEPDSGPPVEPGSVADDAATPTTVVTSPVRLAIITSQTCDVVGTGVGAEHPTVQVSPVVRAEDHFPGKVSAILKDQVGYLFAIPNAPAELGSGTWVADLRISLPVSKSVLVPLVPRSAFPAGDVRALVFAEFVAAKIRRPSFHEGLAENFPKVLRATIKAALKRGDTA